VLIAMRSCRCLRQTMMLPLVVLSVTVMESLAVTPQHQLGVSVVAASYRASGVVQDAYSIPPPPQAALAGQDGTSQGSTTANSPAPPPVVPLKLVDYTPAESLSPSAQVSGAAFGTHHDAHGLMKWLCEPGQGPNPVTNSNCGRVGAVGARGGQAGMEYGATSAHGAVACMPAQYPAAFPPPSCEDTPAFITSTNTPSHQFGWPGSTISPPDSIATSSTKEGPTFTWQVPTLAPPPPSQTNLVNSQTSGIAPQGSCSVGPSDHTDISSGFVIQDFQLPLTCHSNQEAASAGWEIQGASAKSSATLKNYHWHSHNTFTPGTLAYPNRQWFASPCAMPVYKTAYCLAPDRILLGGSTGQIPGELATTGAAVDNNYDAPVLAAGG